MILQLMLTPFFLIFHSLLIFIPEGVGMPSWLDDTISLISKGLIFFPLDVWLILMGSIIFWLTAHMGWAIVEWCYKKLPGVS